MSTSTATALPASPTAGGPEPLPDETVHSAGQAVVRVAVHEDHQHVTERLRRAIAPCSDRAVVMHSTQAGASELVLALQTRDLLDLLEALEAGDTPGQTAQTGPARQAARPEPSPVLSPREQEVVSLIAAGLPNREVAARLYLTDNTLKSYIRSAYRKMGVRTRSQAVGWAFAHGLA